MFFTDDAQIPSVNTIINGYKLDYCMINTPSSVLFNARDVTNGKQKVLKFVKRFRGKD